LVSQTHRNLEIFGIVDNAVGFRVRALARKGEVGDNVYWKAEFDSPAATFPSRTFISV